MLAFDEALAAGADPSAIDGPASSLHAVHECQRLLEAVWPRSVPATADLPGRFGRFSIVREVGRGGFGVVFLAVDPDLRRRVALKVPRPEVLVAELTRRRFLREAEAASRLDHPHIVPVYEVGEEGPVCYIASAYCDGPTLAEWQRRRTEPVPWIEAARLVATLAAAVAHAHQRGILHRDLKPGNILLQPGEASGPGSDARRPRPWRLPAPDLRLRPGQAARRGLAGDRHRPGDRLAALHGPRAGRRPAPRAGPRDRRLCAGGDPLRAADGPAAAPGRDRPGDAAPGRATRTRPRRVPCAPGCRATSRRSA